MKTNKKISFPNVKRNKVKVFDNTHEDQIKINVSQAKVLYQDYVKNSKWFELFISFVGLLITDLIAIFTSDFHDIFGLLDSKYYVKSFFIVLAIAFGIVAIIFLIFWLRTRKKYNINNFIKDLKDYNSEKEG